MIQDLSSLIRYSEAVRQYVKQCESEEDRVKFAEQGLPFLTIWQPKITLPNPMDPEKIAALELIDFGRTMQMQIAFIEYENMNLMEMVLKGIHNVVTFVEFFEHQYLRIQST
jgi:hypothetical protein